MQQAQPLGIAPVLQHGEVSLAESASIME
ncbi:hypothetical protein HER31_03685 [Ferrimonas lipolytica]|uniref:Uncharacterized protein n=1 Tax=Ferrimonas lipolytica TaxID=2724191 RepID=A0A6H1UI68_9GAMM|nr:hypothetical protein HER31_03685 [Ferrimonas lipolytica]